MLSRDMETGFVFSPADHELTDLYLGGQIAGRPVFSTFIHHADLYSAAPAELVAGREHVRDRDGNNACYLISRVRYASKKKKRKLRTIIDDPGKSYWHSEAGKKSVEGSAVSGYVQDFVYAIKKDGHVERLGWRMKEYGVSMENGDGDLVLCKVYRTPRKPSTPPTRSLCDVIDTCNKRKAAGGHPEDTKASARPRHTVEDDEHPLPVVQSPDLSELILFDDDDHQGHTDTGDEIISDAGLLEAAEFDDSDLDQETDWFALLAGVDPQPERDDAAPPPSNFLCNTEQGFLSLYHNDVVSKPPPCEPTAPPPSNPFVDNVGQEICGLYYNDVMTVGPGSYLAAPPCQPAAQPEHAAVLLQSISSDHRMDASSGVEEGAQPEHGLPSCPAFSPEMIRRCSDDVMMPWPLSPTSTAMFLS